MKFVSNHKGTTLLSSEKSSVTSVAETKSEIHLIVSWMRQLPQVILWSEKYFTLTFGEGTELIWNYFCHHIITDSKSQHPVWLYVSVLCPVWCFSLLLSSCLEKATEEPNLMGSCDLPWTHLCVWQREGAWWWEWDSPPLRPCPH